MLARRSPALGTDGAIILAAYHGQIIKGRTIKGLNNGIDYPGHPQGDAPTHYTRVSVIIPRLFGILLTAVDSELAIELIIKFCTDYDLLKRRLGVSCKSIRRAVNRCED
ncbi:hypothetical protein D0962_33265 [Leptolyngbyaceae cyanobacterium CCMR0082]|uniref:Uncharacterized protein n=1 Tax=Adonisia turfae CCMR0082 TaxID=2304604 RepID=A0A6M0SGH3_9CYAN|nr:hypothetical protein [Adonisia turfae CCMR0082]